MNEWWMMNDWWMMNAEWMMNDKWWMNDEWLIMNEWWMNDDELWRMKDEWSDTMSARRVTPTEYRSCHNLAHPAPAETVPPRLMSNQQEFTQQSNTRISTPGAQRKINIYLYILSHFPSFVSPFCNLFCLINILHFNLASCNWTAVGFGHSFCIFFCVARFLFRYCFWFIPGCCLYFSRLVIVSATYLWLLPLSLASLLPAEMFFAEHPLALATFNVLRIASFSFAMISSSLTWLGVS